MGGCDVLTFGKGRTTKQMTNLNAPKQGRNAAKPWPMKGKCLWREANGYSKFVMYAVLV